MKIHIMTIGKPKFDYAKEGWKEYLSRLQKYHDVKITHLPDKFAYDPKKIQEAIGSSYLVALEITGKQFSSPELASFLEKRALEAREVCFIIGGPEGLPKEVIASANTQLSFSKLTFPHDLAMVVLAEALYRATTITAQLPYHK